MLRIFLIVAIVAGIAAGVVTMTKVQTIIVTTRADRDSWHKKDTDEVSAHNKTKKTLADTKATLDKTQKTLEQTQGELAAANSERDALAKDKTDLTAKLEKASTERDDALDKLEVWRQIGLTPQQVRETISNLNKEITANKALTGENKLIATDRDLWQNKYNAMFPSDAPVVLPTGLRGKIVAVDPKFNFVVLNIGEEQGAKTRGEMMVDRNGKLLGKIRIQSVSKDECVANILPDWKRGEVMEGDEVLY
ncbi:MAG TPA: hypothetical protein VGO59_05935 [Verrucomicrobiae bacterium]|jgi:hypothetical protein